MFRLALILTITVLFVVPTFVGAQGIGSHLDDDSYYHIFLSQRLGAETFNGVDNPGNAYKGPVYVEQSDAGDFPAVQKSDIDGGVKIDLQKAREDGKLDHPLIKQ